MDDAERCPGCGPTGLDPARDGWARYLLSGDDFVTRDHCGHWSAPWVAASVTAEAAIAAAYMLIAWGCLRLYRDRLGSWPRKWLFFAGFVAACSLTHAMQSLAFVWPAYRFGVLVSWACVLASLPTVAMLPVLYRFLLGRGG